MSEPSPRVPSDNAGVIAPPPLIGLATVVVGVLLDWLMPLSVLSRLVNWPVRAAIGALLFVAGAPLLVIAERTFRRIGTNVPPWEPTLKLATAGIYERTRNPMYSGVFLMMAGFAIAFALDWMLLLIVLAALVIHFGVVLREERYLEAKFGDEYRAYKARVPRYGWRIS